MARQVTVGIEGTRGESPSLNSEIEWQQRGAPCQKRWLRKIQWSCNGPGRRGPGKMIYSPSTLWSLLVHLTGWIQLEAKGQRILLMLPGKLTCQAQSMGKRVENRYGGKAGVGKQNICYEEGTECEVFLVLTLHTNK